MKKRRSRLGLVGVLALALCLAVGLASGSVADAKKGKKKKGGKGGSVTISKTTPTVIPPSTPPPPVPPATPINRSVVSVPFTVGKKAKNKVVSLNSVSFTFTIMGSARTGAGTANDVPAAASRVDIRIIAPNGRAVGLPNPGFFDQNATTIGPTTVMTDSPFNSCDFDFMGTDDTVTFCDVNDPSDVVKPPSWTGTIGDSELAKLGGVPAKGTWTAEFRNFSLVTPATVNSFSGVIGLQAAPSA